MAEAGLSEWFPQLVAHSIHSLTVEDIRYYFKPDVTEDNGIPTGNGSVEHFFRISENPAVCTFLQLLFILMSNSFNQCLCFSNVPKVRAYCSASDHLIRKIFSEVCRDSQWFEKYLKIIEIGDHFFE